MYGGSVNYVNPIGLLDNGAGGINQGNLYGGTASYGGGGRSLGGGTASAAVPSSVAPVTSTIIPVAAASNHYNHHNGRPKFTIAALQHLKPYSLEANDKHYRNNSEFMEKFEELMSFLNADDETKINAFGLKLIGNGQSWFKTLSAVNKIEWSAFRDQFLLQGMTNQTRSNQAECPIVRTESARAECTPIPEA